MNADNSETGMPRQISETYRELATESAPEHLNQAILKQAAVEVTHSRGYLFAGWLKPVAWTAVIALSLAVVLELTELQTLSIPDSAAPASSIELRTEESSVESEFTRIQPAQKPDARERAESVAKPMARKASVVPAGCDDATRASPDDWLECIRKLRESGAEELADREYEAFILEYPPD
jgi:hypothetical protein